MNMLLPVFLIAVSAYTAQANFSTGKCLTIPVIKNVDLNRYVGEWYEIERYNAFFERNLKCGKGKYGIINDNTLSIENSGVDKKTGELFTLSGRATINSPATAMNQLTLFFPIQVAGITVFENEGAYNIWDTDYDTYTLIYSCKEIIPGIVKAESASVMSRQKTLSAETTQYLKDVLATEGLNMDTFEVIAQDC
jgi:apolipoprotein D and lipocalin family protein